MKYRYFYTAILSGKKQKEILLTRSSLRTNSEFLQRTVQWSTGLKIWQQFITRHGRIQVLSWPNEMKHSSHYIHWNIKHW
jgi:hypothetical protein